MTDVETIVIGGGVMGVASALALARRDRETLLLEQFDLGHDLGSSHGRSRILRFAYFEHPDYARLVMRAEPLWRRLERESGTQLVHRCGGLDIGPPDCELVSGSLRACRELDLPYEYLDRPALEARFPFVHQAPVVGVYQPNAGILPATTCVQTIARLAQESGAVIRDRAPVLDIHYDANHVTVVTENERLRARHTVVTAGSWSGRLLADLRLRLIVRRKFVAFFEPADPRLFQPDRFPIFIYQEGECFFYGFPIFGGAGVKIGDHAGGDVVDPDNVDRSAGAAEVEHLRAFLRSRLPGVDGPQLDHRVCLYTMTGDSDFIVDRHPACDRLTIAAGFSGHGFKFAPVIGEILADLALTGATDHPISRFRLSRFDRS